MKKVTAIALAFMSGETMPSAGPGVTTGQARIRIHLGLDIFEVSRSLLRD